MDEVNGNGIKKNRCALIIRIYQNCQECLMLYLFVTILLSLLQRLVIFDTFNL